MTASPTGVLGTIGDLSVDEFMRRHWQREPALIRAALPNWQSPVNREVLFELASRDDITSRRVSRRGDRWTMQPGPFDALPGPRQRGWTVLVNGIDRHLDAAHELMRRFRFVPDARLDDLMASYATDGGGVGPHTDSYDVFLLQAQGRRRWRVAPPGDSRWVEGAPLKLLAQFEPTQDWVLEPGDMLYVPPGWGHEGTALGECITLSIGFRAPSRQEFLGAFLATCADDPGGGDARFGDRARPPTRHPAQLPEDLSDTLAQWAHAWRPTRAQVERFIGSFLTEPARDVWFDTPDTLPSLAQFRSRASRHGLALDRRTRMAWRAGLIFINGESVHATPAARVWLRRLADDAALSAAQCRMALTDETVCAQLYEWACAGWLHSRPAASTGRVAEGT